MGPRVFGEGRSSEPIPIHLVTNTRCYVVRACVGRVRKHCPVGEKSGHAKVWMKSQSVEPQIVATGVSPTSMTLSEGDNNNEK